MKSIDRTISDNRPIGWAYVSPLRRERIEAGVQALARIDKHVTFHEWHTVGIALVDLREAAMDQCGANGPIGKGYNAAWALVVGSNSDLAPLSKLDTSTRTNAMWMADNWDVVAEWHAELDDAVRRLVNHPATVKRRYLDDFPLPPKPRRPRADGRHAEPEDEPGELDDETEIYDLGDDREGASMADAGADIVQDWLNQFEALWRRMPAAVRAEIAQRIVLWQGDAAVRATEPAEVDLIDEAAAEITRAVAKDGGAKVRAIAGRKVATSLSGEPTPERLAMVVEEALAKPVTEGEDIFAGLGDEVGRRPVSIDQVLAARPGLKRGQARIIVTHLSHRDWDDQALAEETKFTVATVRRVLKANGFQRQ